MLKSGEKSAGEISKEFDMTGTTIICFLPLILSFVLYDKLPDVYKNFGNLDL